MNLLLSHLLNERIRKRKGQEERRGKKPLRDPFFRLGKRRREGDREERKRIREAEQAPPINHYFFPFPPPFLLLFSVQEMYTLCCTDCTVAMRAISYKGYKLDKLFRGCFGFSQQRATTDRKLFVHTIRLIAS